MALPQFTEDTDNIESQPNKPVIGATALKQLFDLIGAQIKAYLNNTLLPFLQGTSSASNLGQSKAALGTTIQSAIDTLYLSTGGSIPPDGTIDNDKLATDVKVGSLATLTTTEKGSVVGAVNEIALTTSTSNAIKFYGKYSQMSGGSQVSASGTQTTTSFVTFSTEVNDDFNAINIGGAPTKFTIASGITKIKISGMIKTFVRGYAGSGKVTVALFKNNSQVEILSEISVVPTASAYTDIDNTCNIESNILACALNDYFEIKVTSASSGTNSSAQFYSNSTFKMEVLG